MRIKLFIGQILSNKMNFLLYLLHTFLIQCVNQSISTQFQSKQHLKVIYGISFAFSK